jgi:glycerol kinase
MQADILGIPVVRPAVTETTALGAAYFAGLAVGYWKDMATLAEQWRSDAIFTPQMSDDERETQRAGWHRAVERARNWAE